jgi:hypothetical protein
MNYVKYTASIVLFVAFAAFAYGGGTSEPTRQQQEPQTQQQPDSQTLAQKQSTNQQQSSQQPANTARNDGKGMRLGILMPHSQGLNENQGYLPALIQGVLVSDISKFSAISVLDRVSLDRVITETLDLTYEDDLDIVNLGHVAQVGHMMTGNIIKTSTGFSLQINVTDTTPKANTVASYSGICTVAELDDHTAIHRASLELLSQMNVQLNAKARNELERASAPETINAQTALARGVTAQRQGTEVAALSYYLQAAEFDPALQEAESRLKILTASITSGNMGAGVQNDMQWRNQWMARLRETEEFLPQYLKTSPAFYLVYQSSSDQWEIAYDKNTITLTLELNCLPEPTWFEAINRLTRTVRNGLLATGRAEAWRLNWPAQPMKTPSVFADASNTYPVVVEILNARGASIGKQTVNIRFGWFVHNGQEMSGTIVPYLQPGAKVAFPGIDANAVNGNLSIRITSINGKPAESSASQMGTRVLPQHEYNNVQSIADNGLQLDNLRQYTIRFDGNRNVLRGYSGSNVSIVIPWGVSYIDGDSGLQRKGLMSVIIPSSVIVINGSYGSGAFMANRLTSVIIPDSVTSIGGSAFQDNLLTSVTIPNSVISIGNYAFASNNTRSVSIGATVLLVKYQDGWGHNMYHFAETYDNNSRRAGTYTSTSTNGREWKYSAGR